MNTRRKNKVTNEEGGANSQRTLSSKGKVTESKQGSDKDEIMNDI